MRKYIVATLCILLVLMSCLTLYAADQRVVRVGAFNYYPGIFKDTDGAVKGFYVDALADIAQRENIRFEYVYGSWSEGLERIKTGKVDMLTSVALTPERTEFLDYAKTPLLTVWGELYVPLSSDIDGIRAVQGKKIGMMKNDINARHFIDLVRKFDITCEFIEMREFDDVFKAVAAKKVDAGVVSNTFGVARQKEFGLRSTGIAFNPFDIFLAVAKGKNSDLLAMLNTYVHGWRYQTDSVYNKARQNWSHGSDTIIHVIPDWLMTTFAVITILALSALAFIVILKKQVRSKTLAAIESSRRYQIISERQKAILAAVPDIIMEVDTNKVYTWANAAGIEFFGDDVIGKEASEYFEGEQNTYKAVQPLFDKSADVIYVETLQRRRDGTVRLLAWWCKALVDEQGEVSGTLSSARDITEPSQIQAVDLFLAQAFNHLPTEPFFDALARFLAQSLQMDYICIDRLDGDHLNATTVAVWNDGHFEDNVTYALSDTPCGDVVGQKVCCFPASVCQFFPNDVALQELRAESYVGVTLWSHSGQPIGLIAAISRRGLTNRTHAELTLARVAVRAAAELERLDAEAALRTIESRQAKMIANIGDVIVIIDQHGINRFKSPNIEKWFGWTPEELIGASAWDNVHPDDVKAAQGFVGILAEKPGDTDTTEVRYRCKDGSYKWIEITLTNLLNDPDICGILGNYQDISERKQIQEYRDLSREVLQILNEPQSYQTSIQRVVNTLKARTQFDAVGIRLKDGEDFPYCASEGFPEGFLVTENSLIKRDTDQGVCRDKDGTPCLECTCGLVITGTADLTLPFFSPDGSFWVNDSSPLLDIPREEDPRLHPRNECIHLKYASLALIPIRSNNRIVGLIQFNDRRKDCLSLNMIEIFERIADHIGTALMRKQTEAEQQLFEKQLQQTQKLESLGVLAGGIAHDFNNILAIIMGYCSLTRMDYGNAGEHLSQIEKAVERGAALCRQMLAYAGKATLTEGHVNVRTMVAEMVSMLKTTIQQNVVLKPELATDIPFITGDDSQLRQVAMNLIINAAEAIGDADGEIEVKLTKKEITAAQAEKDHLGVIMPADRYICLEVTDNGCGMNNDTRHRIFEPFYTTKFTGRGLGMSAVLGIIKAHNGTLQLESRLGYGTTFRVYLPLQPGKSETEGAEQTTSAVPWQGSGTILLVEDEVQVRAVARILLTEMGFNLIDAANGREALELYQQNATAITLVITDMGMPVMNGYELFYELKQQSPQLPIIISSGFGEGDVASKIPREAIAGMINKPYKIEQLRDVLRGVVEGAKQA